jgi:carbon storage regulator
MPTSSPAPDFATDNWQLTTDHLFAFRKGSKMLVLARQRDESIMIGDDVAVTVVYIGGDKVRLGVNAPRQLAVHRKEVYDAIVRESRESRTVVGADEPKACAEPVEREHAGDRTYRLAAKTTGRTEEELRAMAVQVFGSMLHHALGKPLGEIVWTAMSLGPLNVEVNIPRRNPVNANVEVGA